MDQSTARKIAREVRGIALSEDRWHGQWEKPDSRWGVALAGKFYTEVDSEGNLMLS